MVRQIKQRILEKVNEIPTEGALSTDSTILQAWNDSLWKVANVLPPGELMAQAQRESDETGNSSTGIKDMDNKLVLLVERMDSGGSYRPATEIRLEQSTNALDSDSMFHATEHTPVYWFQSHDAYKSLTDTSATSPSDNSADFVITLTIGSDSTFSDITSVSDDGALDDPADYTHNGNVVTLKGGQYTADSVITIVYTTKLDRRTNRLQLAPEADTGEAVRIHYFEKQKWDTSTEDFDYDNSFDETVRYFPDHAIEAVVLLTAVVLLKELMALQALEDEDAEIVQMITALIQAHEASLNKEMEFLRKDLDAGVPNEN